MTEKIITGEEQLVCYHQKIAALAAAALLLRLLDQPILPYLDITILGVGMFLACGRIGCLMVGCCHGRPSRWGVRYVKDHAEAGFPSYLVGVRLFPIQAVESIFVLGIVALGSILTLKGRPSGTVLAFYTISYGFGRFWIEFARGDTERPYFWGFSEAQWLSLILITDVVVAQQMGALPKWPWSALAVVTLACAMIAVAVHRRLRKTPTHRLLHARHVNEVAEAAARLVAQRTRGGFSAMSVAVPREIHVVGTSLGIQISAGKLEHRKRYILHYVISQRTGVLTSDVARILAKLLLLLQRSCSSSELIQGSRGVYHLLIRPHAGA